MELRHNSIKNQLLISFLPIVGFFFFAMITGMILLKQAQKIKSFKDQLVLVDNNFEMILSEELIFLQSENNDFSYHQTGQSDRLDRIEQKYASLHTSIDALISHSWMDEFTDSNTLSSYRDKIIQHQKMFNKLVLLVRQRGVKDFGLIGEMRNYIHEIEQSRGLISLTEILFLRRHEKDFLLRNQEQYIDKLNMRANVLLSTLKTSGNGESKTYINLLAYTTTFNKLVLVIDSIGNFKKDGLKYEFEQNISDLELTSDSILDKSDDRERSIIADINLSFFVVMIFSFVASVIASFTLAKFRSTPIIKFSNEIKKQLDRPVLQKIKPSSIKGASNELRALIKSYNLLIKKLKEQFDVTKDQNLKLVQSNEKLVKVNKELDNFVYRVSHDLRAPLASIMGIAQLNKMSNKIDELKENNVLVEQSIYKMDYFIKDIIDLSRNSRVEIVAEKINLESLINGVVEHHRFMKNADRIDVQVKIIDQVNFYSDRQRLNVIFSNLIANAFKYSDLRKTRQYVKFSGTIDKDSLMIDVEDNGVGISSQYLEKVFDMFFRASYYSKGSGLGLYIVKETISRLEGEISVESVEGMLTIFRIQIPNLITKSKPSARHSGKHVEEKACS